MKKNWKLALTIVGFTLFFALIRGGYYVGYTEGYNKGFSKGMDTVVVIQDHQFSVVMDSAKAILKSLESYKVENFKDHSEIKP